MVWYALKRYGMGMQWEDYNIAQHALYKCWLNSMCMETDNPWRFKVQNLEDYKL